MELIMDNTDNLNLPFILAAQAQKHITHNEALKTLDAIIHLSVIDKDLSTPPPTPQIGDRYIVANTATDEWLGKETQVAAWQDGAWMFYVPQNGWQCWLEDENSLVIWDGTNWVTQSGGSANLNPATGGLVGINATADTTNRLSLNSPASLFNHEGSDHQLKINKNAEANTASVLFQNNFSGRAEFGLTGDDDFHMKVSPDGSTFHDALKIDKDTGHINCSRLFSGSITIEDDTVGRINTPCAGGFIFILANDPTYPQIAHSGVFVFDVGSSRSLASIYLGALMSNLGTIAVDGTTGTDGETGITARPNAIDIENRFGSTRTYTYVFIG